MYIYFDKHIKDIHADLVSVKVIFLVGAEVIYYIFPECLYSKMVQ